MRKICCIQEEAVLEREQEAAQCLWTDAGEVWVLSCKQCGDTRINQDNNIVRAMCASERVLFQHMEGTKGRSHREQQLTKAFQFHDLIPNTAIMKHQVLEPSGGGYGGVKGRHASRSSARGSPMYSLLYCSPVPHGHTCASRPPFDCLFFDPFLLELSVLKCPPC